MKHSSIKVVWGLIAAAAGGLSQAMPVNLVTGQFDSQSFLPMSAAGDHASKRRLATAALQSKVHEKMRSSRAGNVVPVLAKQTAVTAVSALVETSAVVLPSGATVFKFAHHVDGKPVLGDWASSRVASGGWVDRVQYRLSRLQDVRNSEFDARKTSAINGTDVAQIAQNLGMIVLAEPMQEVWFRPTNQGQTALQAAVAVTAGKIHESHNGPIGAELHRPELYKLVLHASTGEVLQKAPISAHLGEHEYRIYADDTPLQPFQNPYGYTSPSVLPEPGDPRPSTFVDQQDFTISELSNTVNDPWLPDNATETVGNNVDVFFNFTRDSEGVFNFFGDGYGPQYRARGDEFDQDFRAPIRNGNELLFNYDPAAYLDDYNQQVDSATNPSAEQVEQINAQIVNAFYLANLMHDLFYDAGFTESAGNAQVSNFGRGGVGGDPLLIHINTFTFISTPGDGESPVIHLGASFGGSTAFDLSVFAHEWAHYLFRRLVNPNLDITDNQARALNEGWADVVGVLMAMKTSDFANAQSPGFKSSYAAGGYFRQDLMQPGFLNPFFYGIRRYPYGPSNPLTFEHLAHKAPLPEGFDFSNYIGRGTVNSQIHTAGEIWANAVLACFKDVIANSAGQSFTDVRQTLANITVAGMANSPENPTFLEARDALLSALRANFSQHYAQCKVRFAQSGMGSGAVAPPRESKDFTERVASFSLADFNMSIVDATLIETGGGLDNDGVFDASENGVLQLTLRNTGFEPISSGSVELLPNNNRFQRLGSGRVAISSLAIGADITINLPIRLTHEQTFDLTPFVLRVAVGGTEIDLTTEFRTHFDVRPALADEPLIENFEFVFARWQLDRIQEQSFVDSSWQSLVVDDNEVLEIQEPVLQVERQVRRALVSPWLTRTSAPLTFTFDHAFNLFGEALVEVSTDDETWQPFDEAQPSFLDLSSGFPALTPASLANNTLTEGQRFKLRLRVDAPTPLTWRLDNFKLIGVQTSPFDLVAPEDGVDENAMCFPIKSPNGIAVVCL